MKIQSMTVGKSRSVELGKNKVWVKCDVTASFEEQPSEAEVNELLSIVEETLEMEEASERERWNDLKNKPRQQ